MIRRIGIHRSVRELFPPEVLRDKLAEQSADVTVADGRDEVADRDALVTFTYDDSFIEANLMWIHSIQAGVDRFPLEEFDEAGVTLTSSTGIHGDSVGETVVGYMLQFARRLHVHRDNQHRQVWRYPNWDEAFTLDGESLCIVGLGTLGRGIARRADALGMDVHGVKRSPTPVEHVGEIYTPNNLHDAIADTRFVAVAVPLTPETEGMVGADELAAMRDDAYLINVSRGSVIDEKSVLAALRDDELAGAALDVFATEPLPRDHPLWQSDDVVVTPHAAAANVEYCDRVADLVCENLRRFAHGEEPVNRVV